MSVKVAAAITNAEVRGCSLNSTDLVFMPGPIRPGDYYFDVGEAKASAGSASLVFQTILPPLSFASISSRLRIKGGTHVEWSPTADYIESVFLPSIRRMGVEAELRNPVAGYYPIGKGELEAFIRPSARPLMPLDLKERGMLKEVSITSAASNLPVSIAERQVSGALAALKGLPIEPSIRVTEPPSEGRGTYLFILARFENAVAGFSALGARGKRAEAVGGEAAEKLLHFIEGKGTVERHLADQLAIYMALARGLSSVTIEEATGHLRTNIHVIEKFLPVKFTLAGTGPAPVTLEVEGCGRA